MERKPLPKRKSPRLPQYDYGQCGYYFVTICTKVRNRDTLGSIIPWERVGGGLCPAPPTVCLTPAGKIVEDAITAIPSLYAGVEIDTYCIMPDHVHLIIAIPAGRDRARPLPGMIGRFKSYTDHGYRGLTDKKTPGLWQRGFYDHVIRNDADLDAARRYVRNNPVKKQERESIYAEKETTQ